MTIEFSRPIQLSKIGATGLTVVVQASREECAAVAARMDLPAIRFLECSFDVRPEDDGISFFAHGRLSAEVTRVCVTSAEDFDVPIEELFEIRLVPAGEEREDDLDPELPDEIPYDGGVIDLGEATSEQLGLALDPYPRMDGATVPTIDDDAEPSPFSILSRRSGPDKQ